METILKTPNEIRSQLLVEQIREEVREEMDLWDVYPDIASETRDKTSNLVAEICIDVRGMLDLPKFQINVNPLPSPSDDQLAAFVTPMDFLHKPEFIFVYGHNYLKDVMKALDGPRGFDAEWDLRFNTAHELYHMSQWLKWPNVMRAEGMEISDIEREETRNKWQTLKTEVAADLFGLKYLRSLKVDLKDQSRKNAFIERKEKDLQTRPLIRETMLGNGKVPGEKLD